MVWHIKRASKFNPKLLCWNRTDSNLDLSQALVDLFYKYVSSAIESTFFCNELDLNPRTILKMTLLIMTLPIMTLLTMTLHIINYFTYSDY